MHILFPSNWKTSKISNFNIKNVQFSRWNDPKTALIGIFVRIRHRLAHFMSGSKVRLLSGFILFSTNRFCGLKLAKMVDFGQNWSTVVRTPISAVMTKYNHGLTYSPRHIFISNNTCKEMDQLKINGSLLIIRFVPYYLSGSALIITHPMH